MLKPVIEPFERGVCVLSCIHRLSLLRSHRPSFRTFCSHDVFLPPFTLGSSSVAAPARSLSNVALWLLYALSDTFKTLRGGGPATSPALCELTLPVCTTKNTTLKMKSYRKCSLQHKSLCSMESFWYEPSLTDTFKTI